MCIQSIVVSILKPDAERDPVNINIQIQIQIQIHVFWLCFVFCLLTFQFLGRENKCCCDNNKLNNNNKKKIMDYITFIWKDGGLTIYSCESVIWNMQSHTQ